jgi:hypothetical protein
MHAWQIKERVAMQEKGNQELHGVEQQQQIGAAYGEKQKEVCQKPSIACTG